MSLKTVISITFVFMVLIVAGTILYSIADYLRYAGLFLLGVAGLFIVGLTLLSGLWLKERFDQSVIASRKQNIDTIQDGLGQLFVIDHKRDTIRALTTNPKTHINGHFEEPTQAEMMLQALFFQAIGKGHTNLQPSTPLLLPSTTEQIPDLMGILRTAQRVLIRAASDGGKTTLLRHIADSRIKQGGVIVLDSQSYPDKWPVGCKVVSEHADITVALDNLIDLMVRRYREINQGLVQEGKHPKLSIVIDEWMAIVNQCPNASDVIQRLLTESRKAAFSVFIGAHSERVKSLGLDGRGDLRDGFLIVRIDNENGQRVCTYDYGRGERPCTLPGEYIMPQEQPVFEIEAIAKPVASELEQRIIDLFEDNKSFNQIAKAVYGTTGGNQTKEIKATLAKFGYVDV